MIIKILSSAIDDLYKGRIFYQSQGNEVGEYFFDSLFSDIDSLAIYGGIHSLFHGYYRLLSVKFPYAVYYKLDHEVVIVYRVLDLRQNPLSLKGKLSKG